MQNAPATLRYGYLNTHQKRLVKPNLLKWTNERGAVQPTETCHWSIFGSSEQPLVVYFIIGVFSTSYCCIWVTTRKGRWKFKRYQRTYFTCLVTGFWELYPTKHEESLRVLVKFQSLGSYKQGISAKPKSPLHPSLSTVLWKQCAHS